MVLFPSNFRKNQFSTDEAALALLFSNGGFPGLALIRAKSQVQLHGAELLISLGLSYGLASTQLPRRKVVGI